MVVKTSDSDVYGAQSRKPAEAGPQIAGPEQTAIPSHDDEGQKKPMPLASLIVQTVLGFHTIMGHIKYTVEIQDGVSVIRLVVSDQEVGWRNNIKVM